MSAALRSVLVVNRSSLIGTAIILALSAALLTANGAWLEAGIRDDKLAALVGIASSFAGTVVLITVFIVASVFSSALRQRLREFALLRAVGATAAQVRRSVTAEALVLLLISAPIGAAIGFGIAPLLTPLLESAGMVPSGFALPFSPLSFVAALIIIVPTGLIAALTAARGILKVSPTAAVRVSAAEPAGIPRGRLLAAAAVTAAGAVAALTPFFAPGTLGSAAGAVSAILFIVAAALAAPVLVHWSASRAVSLAGSTAGAARSLAVANARGFSRRLSAAIIPLALLLALGSVQSGVNAGISSAAGKDLQAGIQADLIIESPVGITEDQANTITALPGVTAVTTTTHVTASVRTESVDQDSWEPGGLSWEQISLLSISPGNLLLDPAVQSGSLDDLTAADTIAVSQDALTFTGKGIGDTIDLRVDGTDAVTAKIVAIYERGLGFGDYIVGASTDSTGTNVGFDTLFVTSTPDSRAQTLTAINALGLTAADRDAYVHNANASSAGGQQLSLWLLLALLGFVAAAAANTLVSSTRSRRPEFALLMRLGATRGQVMRMVALETGFVILAALTLGLLAVLPALTGVGQGLLGVPLPTFNLAVLAGLVISTVVISVLSIMPTAWIATSATKARR